VLVDTRGTGKSQGPQAAHYWSICSAIRQVWAS